MIENREHNMTHAEFQKQILDQLNSGKPVAPKIEGYIKQAVSLGFDEFDADYEQFIVKSGPVDVATMLIGWSIGKDNTPN